MAPLRRCSLVLVWIRFIHVTHSFKETCSLLCCKFLSTAVLLNFGNRHLNFLFIRVFWLFLVVHEFGKLFLKIILICKRKVNLVLILQRIFSCVKMLLIYRFFSFLGGLSLGAMTVPSLLGIRFVASLSLETLYFICFLF